MQMCFICSVHQRYIIYIVHVTTRILVTYLVDGIIVILHIEVVELLKCQICVLDLICSCNLGPRIIGLFCNFVSYKPQVY